MKYFVAALSISLAFAGLAGYVMWKHADASHWCNDGATYRFQGNTLARGMLFAPEPPAQDAFGVPMVLTHEGKWFGQYYPGYPLLLGASARAHLDWMVNPLLGGALVLGTFALGRRLYGAASGLVAAFLLACSPLLLAMSTTYLSHVACASLLLFSAYALARGVPDADWRWGLLSGFLFGWGVATRPFTGALMAVTLAIPLLMVLRHRGRGGLGLGVAFAAAAIPWGLALFAWNQLLTGDPLVSPYELKWPLHGLGFHEISPHRRFIAGKEIDHYSPAIAWIATKRQLTSLGNTFLPFRLPGLFLLVFPLVFFRTLGWKGALAALFPLSLVAGHFFYPGTMGVSVTALGPRYYSEGLPALALLLACPIVAIASRNRVSRWGLWLLLLGMGLAAGLRTVPDSVNTVRSLHRDPVSGPNRILERHLGALPEKPRIIFVDISTYNRSSAMLVNRPDLTGTNIVAVYREPARNRAVLDAFPGREAYLMRWDRERAEVQLSSYVPEEDTEGPPKRFPYHRGRRQQD